MNSFKKLYSGHFSPILLRKSKDIFYGKENKKKKSEKGSKLFIACLDSIESIYIISMKIA